MAKSYFLLELSSLARFLRGGSVFVGCTEEQQIPRSAVQMIGALNIFSAERGMTVSMSSSLTNTVYSTYNEESDHRLRRGEFPIITFLSVLTQVQSLHFVICRNA